VFRIEKPVNEKYHKGTLLPTLLSKLARVMWDLLPTILPCFLPSVGARVDVAIPTHAPSLKPRTWNLCYAPPPTVRPLADTGTPGPVFL